jgi:hypothetical protein
VRHLKSRTLATYSSISATAEGVNLGTRIVDGPDAEADHHGRPAYMSLSPEQAVDLARLLVEYAARSLNSRDHEGTLRSPTCDYSQGYNGGEWGDVCVLPYGHEEDDHLYRSMLLNLPEHMQEAHRAPQMGGVV